MRRRTRERMLAVISRLPEDASVDDAIESLKLLVKTEAASARGDSAKKAAGKQGNHRGAKRRKSIDASARSSETPAEGNEDFRIRAACPSCGSDRVYLTDMLCGFGAPALMAAECAACHKQGEAWGNHRGKGLLLKWDDSKDIVPTDFIVPDSQVRG